MPRHPHFQRPAFPLEPPERQAALSPRPRHALSRNRPAGVGPAYLALAATMFGDMDMRSWLEKTQAEMDEGSR